MKVAIFKTKLNKTDFEKSDDLETSFEKFEDSVNDYVKDLVDDDCEIVDIEFTFFEDDRAIAVVKYKEETDDGYYYH